VVEVIEGDDGNVHKSWDLCIPNLALISVVVGVSANNDAGSGILQGMAIACNSNRSRVPYSLDNNETDRVQIEICIHDLGLGYVLSLLATRC
jgi:hypothetical protein